MIVYWINQIWNGKYHYINPSVDFRYHKNFLEYNSYFLDQPNTTTIECSDFYRMVMLWYTISK